MSRIISTDIKAFFSGIIQNVMYTDIGICAPEISDYLIDLLISYLHVNDLFPFRENGEVMSIENLLKKLANREQKRKVYRYVGDFALFWGGLFPENIKNLEHIGLGFSAKDYMKNGKYFYSTACTFTQEGDVPPVETLRKLSSSFEDCVYGLKLVRREIV